MRVIEIDHSLSPLSWDRFCLIRSLELSTLLSVTAGFNCNKGVGVRAYSSGGNEAKKNSSQPRSHLPFGEFDTFLQVLLELY